MARLPTLVAFWPVLDVPEVDAVGTGEVALLGVKGGVGSHEYRHDWRGCFWVAQETVE